MLDFLRKLIESKSFAKAWEYCKGKDGPCKKQKWFGALQEVCRKKRDNSHGDEREKWEKRRADCEREKREAAKRCKLKHQSTNWPENGHFNEFLYHHPGPHLHVASSDRYFLIRVCEIGRAEYNLRIGEFPPFDTVECVHVNGSWHYRDSSAPFVPRSCAGRGNGLAADINDADGGNDQEVAFMNELQRRYR